MKRFIGILALVLVILLVPTGATIQVEASTQSPETLQIDEDLTTNYYGGAELVKVDGDAERDLVLTGETVIVNGTVSGNLIVAGSSVELNGDVVGDVFVAGGNVIINGKVEGDIRALGAQVFVTSDEVGGDLVVGAGRLNLNQDIVVNGITAYSTGVINSNLSSDTLSLDSVVGASYQVESIIDAFSGVAIVSQIIGFVLGLVFMFGGLIANYLLIRFFPVFTEKSLDRMATDRLYSVVVGLGVFVFAPIISLLLIFTGIGVPLWIALVALGVVAYIFASAFGTYLIGRILLKKGGYNNTGRFLPLLVGTLTVYILGWLPLVGWLFGGLLSVLLPAWGIGAIILNKVHYLRTEPQLSE